MKGTDPMLRLRHINTLDPSIRIVFESVLDREVEINEG